MPDFQPLPARDAWPTIRGYVYQVDHSILRWLDLRPDELLELERGEDIDLVLPGLAEGDNELLRRLEQVKHREGNLTLRSPEVLAAIANFHMYRASNPAARLSFCFTTNAQAGREKPTPMPERRPALVAWNDLHNDLVDSARQPQMIEGIRLIVANASAPNDITPERWKSTVDFFASATHAELLDFIGAFEWSMGAGEAPNLGAQVRERLLTYGAVSDETAAQAIYERLFLHVFKVLTQSGVKRLTQDDLIPHLAQPTLSAADAQQLTSLMMRVREIDRRISAVEGTLAEHGMMLERVSVDLEQLARPEGQLGIMRATAEIQILDVPPLAERRSERQATVERLAATTIERTWIALYGGVGTGKTQLGVLLVRQLAVRTLWLTLRGLDPSDAGDRLDAACAAVVGNAASFAHADWYRAFCSTSGVGSLIILDDLPRFESADELGRRLTLLAYACAEVGTHLLTTSVYPLPSRLRAMIPESMLHETLVPPFTNAEATELLRAYGAPDRLLATKPVAFLNSIAGQHPLLLVAIARFLANDHWRVSNANFEDLIQRTFATDINDETMHHLLTTVEDGDSRELLYRLTLSKHPLTLEDVRALAAIPRPVARPRERLHALSGLWVQQDAGERFLVSPLVATFGRSELETTTAISCHRILAERIVDQGTMTPPQIVEAITHFQDAMEHNRAGALFAWALAELNKRDVALPDFGLLSAWDDHPMPAEMGLGIRMYARALQVAGRLARGMAVDEMLGHLDSLVGQAATGEAWAMVAVVLTTFGLLDTTRALRYLSIALRLVPTGLGPDGSSLVLPDDMRYEESIWAVVPAIETHDDLRAWLRVAEAMSVAQRTNMLMDEQYAEDSAYVLAEQVWLREADKPREQQDWPGVQSLLQEVAQVARALNLEILWACAVRAEVEVRSKFSNELANAMQMAQAALVEAQALPLAAKARVEFLLRECTGRQYLDFGEVAAAAEWLSAAVADEMPAFPRARMIALLSLSRALFGAADGITAVRYAQRAVDLARANEHIRETDVVRALGELAIVQWKAQDLAAAFSAWDEAGERLYDCRSESEVWQDLYVVYGHISGYFTALATSSEPPAVSAGTEPYVAPKPGMLFNFSVNRAAHYDATKDSYLAAQLAMFAEAVDRDDRAAAWAARGVEWTRDAHQWLALSHLGQSALPPLVLNDQYGTVLETGLESGALTVALPTLLQREERILTQNGEYNELLEMAFGQRPGPLWQQAEEWGFFLGVVPVAFRLATIALQDPARARAAAVEVVALCREIAVSATDTQLWTMAAYRLELTFVTDNTSASARELLDLAARLDENVASGLRVLTRLGASLLVRGSPRVALQIHQGLIPYMRQMLQKHPGMYRQVVTPFVVAFWRKRFGERRVHFRQPSLVETRLNDAIAVLDGDIAQRVIDAVAPGLV